MIGALNLDWSKILLIGKRLTLYQTTNFSTRPFKDYKFKVVNMMISVFDWVENIVGKGENASYKYFILFP